MFSKKLALATAISGIIALLPASNVFAAIDGPYMGVSVGYGDIHQSNVSGLNVTSSMSSGIAGRGFLGFQFSPSFALETGYNKYYNASINGSGSLVANANVGVTSYSIDLLMKGIVPLMGGLSVYGKLGPAYLSENEILNGTTTAKTPPAGQAFRSSISTHKILPEAGIGVSYDFNMNINADIGWLHIQHIGDNTLRNVDFVGLGLAYNLG